MPELWCGKICQIRILSDELPMGAGNPRGYTLGLRWGRLGARPDGSLMAVLRCLSA